MSASQHAPTCFVIMPIGTSGSRIRKRSAAAYEAVISPAAEKAGFAPVRADQLPGSGVVMTSIMEHLTNDSLVVADLTGANPNVYYELALRHAVRKPVLAVIHAGERLPFDISSLRVVEFDTGDQGSIAAAREQLEQLMMRTRQGVEATVSPFSIALPAWQLSAAPGRVPVALVEAIINLLVEIGYLLSAPAISPEPCHRCQRAHSEVRQLEHIVDSLAQALGIHGPSDVRDVIWKRLEILDIGQERS